MKEITRKYYTIPELKELFPKTYAKVIEDNRDWNTDGMWWEYTYDDVKTMLGHCGFTDVDIKFSGFCSQGDGASFTGVCKARDIDEKALSEYAPNETVFHKFALSLKNLMKDYPDCRLTLSRNRSTNYVHENTVDAQIEFEGEVSGVSNTAKEIFASCKVIMREIYRKLEAEYENLREDDNIAENMEANDMYFDENGRKE